MRPVDSTGGHQGGPAVRGQARAAEVHAAKAEGRSPSRAHWRDAAAATPAVEVSISPEAAASAAQAEVPAAMGETAAAVAVQGSTSSVEAPVEAPAPAPEAVIDASSAAAIVPEAIVANSTVATEPGFFVDVLA